MNPCVQAIPSVLGTLTTAFAREEPSHRPAGAVEVLASNVRGADTTKAQPPYRCQRRPLKEKTIGSETWELLGLNSHLVVDNECCCDSSE
jgi:hypothetical protein